MWILQFMGLISYVDGIFEVNVTQTSYQEEEGQNITLEWTFTTYPHSSLKSLYVFCNAILDQKSSALLRLSKGVEVSESQAEQFAGRVQCDKDSLKEGRIRLNISRLRTEDSGLYKCEVNTEHGGGIKKCRLIVTAQRDWSEAVKPESESHPGRGRTGLYCGFGLTATAVSLLVMYSCVFKPSPPTKKIGETESFDHHSNVTDSKQTLLASVKSNRH